MGCFCWQCCFLRGSFNGKREVWRTGLSPHVLRFHILADSDGKEDQQVKLEVRSLILDYVKKHLPDHAGKADTIACLEENREEIEQLADRYLENRGFDYHTSLQLTNCYFPTRSYGELVFPCGYYDAARITLGKGEGHNWWCVLYPQFCFLDTACTAVPQESTRMLQQELTEGDYLALEDNRPDIKIRFFLFPQFGSPDISPADSGKTLEPGN